LVLHFKKLSCEGAELTHALAAKAHPHCPSQFIHITVSL